MSHDQEDGITLSVAVVEDIIDTLERTPCTFWACPGPDKPFEHMKTCSVCATLQDLRAAMPS